MRWDQFGARLGVGLALAGFVIIFLGWNGAASVDRVPSQFPYLISGGLAGLGLVVVGAALMLVQSGREDRARLRGELQELRTAVEKLQASGGATTANGVGDASGRRETGGAGLVVVGPTTYHRPDCRLLEGRGELSQLSVGAAAEQGLTPCRVCAPGASTKATASSGRKRSSRKSSKRKSSRRPAGRKR